MKSGHAVIFLLSDLYNNSIAYFLDIVKSPKFFCSLLLTNAAPRAIL